MSNEISTVPLPTHLLVPCTKATLSTARMGTFERAVRATSPMDPRPLALYVWNAKISGAFIPVLHVCEVSIRNAIAEVLEATYGARWPWVKSFELSLLNPQSGYNPRRDLLSICTRLHTTGKVIPELKFAFWQRMFTQRHDTRLWAPHLRTALPNLDHTLPIPELRTKLYAELEQVRLFRNRIAHHEPIFSRDLRADLHLIEALITYRCPVTADWIMGHQEVRSLLACRP